MARFAIATPQVLAELKRLCPQYPGQRYLDNPWWLTAAVAFAASNEPQEVPRVYEYAVKDLEDLSASVTDKILLIRKLKDALFKSGLLCGYPKAINGLSALHSVLPEDYKDPKQYLRPSNSTTEQLHETGEAYFSHTYGETAGATQAFLREIYPDLEFFSTTFGYGYVYGYSDVLSPAETSFAIIAAQIATDVPKQAAWHLQGAVRNGATRDVVKAVRQISINVSQLAGVTWKDDIPDL